ncbi:MAG: hypothetical protein CM15mP29_3310 [Alphaproteobacteria bacterium]|nr:MAG: hypothetical protein CM15mP29_3310 [Alphaproteobacteria bacterium]
MTRCLSHQQMVGTKLLIAIENDFYDHIGIYLVAMCVNDLIVQGAEPLYFDYFATGQLSNSIAKKLLKVFLTDV